MGFDIDCCCVGYDGNNVWGLPRAQRALKRRYNLVDVSRRSLTYEIRLFKYSKRYLIIIFLFPFLNLFLIFSEDFLFVFLAIVLKMSIQDYLMKVVVSKR
jgi:hypothetical protein